MLITRRLGFEPQTAVDDAMRVLRAVDWSEAQAGLLTYFPVIRGNPFQALLYSRLPTVGLHPVPTYDPATTIQVADAVAGSGLALVVHVHWLNVVLAKAEDTHDARVRIKQYLEQLHRLADGGARIVWTVHNVLPHETRWPELEAELRRGVVDVAERVHVMSPRTTNLVAGWFDVPAESLLTVPHPSYTGVYPSWISREQARLELGIGPEQTVFLLIGRIQPYKGIIELLDAFDGLCAAEPGQHTLLVAGPPNIEDETVAFTDRLRTHPCALAALGKVPDDEMQLYLRAADVAVFPYRRSLNSGAFALALTFGLPVLLPDDLGEAARADGTGYATVYSRDDPDGLRDGLARAARAAGPNARTAAKAAAEEIAPDRVGQRFAEAMRDWLTGPRGLGEAR